MGKSSGVGLAKIYASNVKCECDSEFEKLVDHMVKNADVVVHRICMEFLKLMKSDDTAMPEEDKEVREGGS